MCRVRCWIRIAGSDVLRVGGECWCCLVERVYDIISLLKWEGDNDSDGSRGNGDSL